MIRVLGGTLYLVGMLLMAYNTYRTIIAGKPVDATIPAVSQVHHEA